jgi:hypothetical protein
LCNFILCVPCSNDFLWWRGSEVQNSCCFMSCKLQIIRWKLLPYIYIYVYVQIMHLSTRTLEEIMTFPIFQSVGLLQNCGVATNYYLENQQMWSFCSKWLTCLQLVASLWISVPNFSNLDSAHILSVWRKKLYGWCRWWWTS